MIWIFLRRVVHQSDKSWSQRQKFFSRISSLSRRTGWRDKQNVHEKILGSVIDRDGSIHIRSELQEPDFGATNFNKDYYLLSATLRGTSVSMKRNYCQYLFFVLFKFKIFMPVLVLRLKKRETNFEPFSTAGEKMSKILHITSKLKT